jgi:hypothetical protein
MRMGIRENVRKVADMAMAVLEESERGPRRGETELAQAHRTANQTLYLLAIFVTTHPCGNDNLS